MLIPEGQPVAFRFGTGNIASPEPGTVYIKSADNSQTATMFVGTTDSSLCQIEDDTKAPVNHASTGSEFGVATATEYGHAKASSTLPLPGSQTAQIGTQVGVYALADHQHPLQDVSVADSLSTSAGSTTQPVYFKEGKPATTTYSLSASVPSDAVFTEFTGATSSAAGSLGYVPAPSAGSQNKYLRGDGTWGAVSSGAEINDTTTSTSTTWSSSKISTEIEASLNPETIPIEFTMDGGAVQTYNMVIRSASDPSTIPVTFKMSDGTSNVYNMVVKS